jgi:spore coat polysaccharide biosynthesis predicted glycosyltransferase SpsG
MTARHTALIRCDASPKIGYGHLMRCLALAEQMQATGRWKIILAMVEDAGGINRARSKGFTVEHLRSDHDQCAESHWLGLLIDRHQADALIMDVRSDLGRTELNQLRNTGITVVCIDDISERRLAADLVFYPPVPQVNQLKWADFKGRWYSGWEWILMPAQFAAKRAANHPANNEIPKLLVSMGGSDPAGITLQAIDALDSLDDQFDTVIVIGSAFMHTNALKQRLNNARRDYQLIFNPTSMVNVMADADLALVSFGATAYELACLGIPAVYLCISQDHATSASALDAAGVAINLGLYSQATPNAIRSSIKQLLEDAPRRQHMRDISRTLLDGCGTARIIEQLNLYVEA